MRRSTQLTGLVGQCHQPPPATAGFPFRPKTTPPTAAFDSGFTVSPPQLPRMRSKRRARDSLTAFSGVAEWASLYSVQAYSNPVPRMPKAFATCRMRASASGPKAVKSYLSLHVAEVPARSRHMLSGPTATALVITLEVPPRKSSSQ
jgi:hypothetical protein